MKKINYTVFILILIFIMTSCNNFKEEKNIFTNEMPIDEIDVNWNTGNITISKGETFTLNIISTCKSEISSVEYDEYNQKLLISNINKNDSLEIVLPSKTYKSISINSINSKIDISDISSKMVIIKCNVGMLNIKKCVIDEFYSNIVCDVNWANSTLINNKFRSIYLTYGSIHMITLHNNIYTSASIKVGYGNISLYINTFDTTEVLQESGNLGITLDSTKGFIYTGTQANIDFETINYSDKILYGDCSQQIYCNNIHGVTNIKRR